MVKGLKYSLGKNTGTFIKKYFPTFISGGKAFPGLFFLRFAGYDSLKELTDDRLSEGAILITGTNGKTTTTSMIVGLLSNDVDITKGYGNNTIFSLTTALLEKKADIGVFEYGIRDISHGMPDKVQEWVNPMGVIYTNISREHTQVAGVKNPFEDYVLAKTLLSKGMKGGVVVANCDDPLVMNIGLNKQDDCHVVYYGLDIDETEIFKPNPAKCPKCGKTLEYSKYYMNHRGVYACECGFKRKEPNVRVTNYELVDGKGIIDIEANTYNFTVDKNISFKISLEVSLLGLHNLYNILCSITAYSTFTPKIENIEENVTSFFNSINAEFLPPGRFELINIDDKLVGVGQGDNGDATKVNAMFMNLFVDDELEFIYNTPDLNEEEIFEDHKEVIKALNPNHLIVVPGRQSTEVAKEYYEELKEDFDNSDFYPVKFEFNERIDNIINLVRNSDYKYILITGCGEEEKFWENVIQKLKNMS